MSTFTTELKRKPNRKNGKQKGPAARGAALNNISKTRLSERARVRAILKNSGVIREMTAAEKKIATRWDALPAAQKVEVEETLRGVKIDPPLSQLIHDLRK